LEITSWMIFKMALKSLYLKQQNTYPARDKLKEGVASIVFKS
jgi:hypothetical protein